MAIDDSLGEKKRLPQWLSSIVPSPLTEKAPTTTSSPHDEAQNYLIGLRGCLAMMSFLWTFLVTFAPAAVYGSSVTTGSGYQLALRKSLSVLFWNESLIYSSFIFLSARTICVPFLLDSNKTVLASAVVRRGLRLWFPTAASLVVCYIVFTKTIGTAYLENFANSTNNTDLNSNLYAMPSSLVNFNSIFEIFWVSHNFSYQAGCYAFPTQTLWIVSAIFQQSYTVFTTMVIIPFTRKKWRMYGAFFFIATAWWVYSWAWFSITGLLFADLVMNLDLKARCQALRLWSLTLAGACMLAGFAMQFTWAAARPDLQTAEINYHTGVYTTGGVYTWNDTTAPQLRADNYLVIVGFYILLESTDVLQKIFGNPVFRFIGQRSYSYFLLQSIIAYTLGIRTAMQMTNNDPDAYSKAAGVAFIATLLVTLAAGEAFYWLFDKPSQIFARIVFAWLRE